LLYTQSGDESIKNLKKSYGRCTIPPGDLSRLSTTTKILALSADPIWCLDATETLISCYLLSKDPPSIWLYAINVSIPTCQYPRVSTTDALMQRTVPCCS